MAREFNADILAVIASYLHLEDPEDKKILITVADEFKLTDNEKTFIAKYWIAHTDFSVLHETFCTEYYVNGVLHREDGPAAIWRASDCERYYINGKLHRDNGPAVIFRCGIKKYYKHGKLHREDGPAAIYSSGEQYYRDDKLHRDDGPAAIYANGTEQYYRDDKFYYERSVDRRDYLKIEKNECWLMGERSAVEVLTPSTQFIAPYSEISLSDRSTQ
jgi:hypothetical protein